ncbi:nitroreductase/quinone reductase family protein [Streptomyces sp. NPDC003300]|uniref:nitroreductase/quinone reductase family protein n=1 Tax=Streptomyces sp. NPDC003300 TaxID=3154446 RepID=UPI0033B7F2E5
MRELPPTGTRGNTIGSVDRTLTRAVTGLHRHVVTASNGRLAATMGGHPLFVLTVRGRRTGNELRHPVIGIRDGATWLVVASNGGAGGHPLWALNAVAALGHCPHRITERWWPPL